MTNVPLSLRLVTSRTDRHVTRQLRSLSFREVADGGFASAAFSLDRPLALQPDDVAYYGRTYIYDTRTGETVWEGRLEDPGRGASMSGEVWQLTALGPAAHARDRRVPLIYADTGLRNLIRADNGTPGGIDMVGGDPGTTGGTQEALVLRFPQSLDVVTNSRVVMRYEDLMHAAQKLARIDYTWDTGMTDVNFQVQAIARTNGSTSGGDVARSDNSNASGSGSSPKVITTHWTAGRNTVEFRLIRGAGGAATLPSDIYWASIRNLVIQGTRYDKLGNELLAAADYTTNTVLAHQIVADLLGRLLPQYDGTNAVIDTTSHAISQLAYPDGVDPAQVFTDLMQLEPAYRWGAYESNAAGLYRFEWRSWPTAVRYEAGVLDGYESQGSADGLYNQCIVRWRDAKGAIRTTIRTSSVPELTAAGLTRTAPIDLGDNIGSAADADRAGDQFLAQHSSPPNAGRLTIARPVLDLVTGRMVAPWSIKAGELVRVRGIRPSTDSLNPAAGPDGATIFRIHAKNYRVTSNDAEAVLELDSDSVTTAHALAQLQSRPTGRRR